MQNNIMQRSLTVTKLNTEIHKTRKFHKPKTFIHNTTLKYLTT